MENSYDLKIMPSIPDTTSFSYATRVRIANPASITKWLLLNRGYHHEQVMNTSQLHVIRIAKEITNPQLK
jgi:hypothetical protein